MLDASSAVEFSEDELRLYLSESGSSSSLDKLLKHKRGNNIAELIGQASVIESDLAQLAVSTGFLEYFHKFKAVRVSAAGHVWATPAAFHWNSMSRMFLDVAHFGVPIHEALHGYLSHLNCSLSQGLAAHLNDFGRFTLAAYIRDRRTVEFGEPIKIRLPSALPGTHLALLPPASDTNSSNRVLNWKRLDQAMLGAIEELRTSANTTCALNISSGPDESAAVVLQKLPVLSGPSGSIAIDGFEPCLRLRSVEVYPRITDPERCRHFVVTVSRALERLAAYDESLVNDLTLITASLTPMDAGASEESMFSGTSSAIFGACFLSATEQPLFLAEMLLHEFCHNKLRLLQEVVPLISDKYLNRWIFYSPWRDEPRPIDGLMHGLYVFSSIADFWLHVWKNLNANEAERKIAQRRVGTLVLQLKFAFDEFSEHAELMSAGKVFLSIIDNRIARLESETKGWELDRLQSLFSGVLKDQRLKELPILESVPRHKKNWEATYRA
jgi:HEXXH motif-containing protein